MGQARIWNVTDDPATDLVPRILTVFGVAVSPGRFILVDSGRLEGAHKLKKDEEAGLVFIGHQPAYKVPKVRLTLPKEVNRAHHQEGGSTAVGLADHVSDLVVPDSLTTSVEDVSINVESAPPEVPPKRRRKKKE